LRARPASAPEGRAHPVKTRELQFTDRSELEAPATPDQHANYLSGKDLTRRSRGAQTCCFHNGQAEAVVAVPFHVAGADSHSYPQRHSELPRHTRNRALHLDACAYGSTGRGEHGHQSVAGVLQETTAVRLDDQAERGIVRATHLVCAIIAYCRPQLRRTDHIGEEHRRRPGITHRRNTLPARER
jgi:hypothetical protein